MTPVIFVLGGVNGAGKTSIAGAALREHGVNYYNPDEAASETRDDLTCSIDEANELAWLEGKRRLEAAIRQREDYAFESTLGGTTIPRLLLEAAHAGFDVRVLFVGLSTAEQHVERVRARVAAGGHDIPERRIRERWNASRLNIVTLMPHLTELRVFDNSEERDAKTGKFPPMRLVLHWSRGAVVAPPLSSLEKTPEWAKPIVARALELQRSGV